MDSFDFEAHRETEAAGALEPPRRRPPTAVGTGQLPPRGPGDPGDVDDSPESDDEPYMEPSRLRRIALTLLALQLIATAVLLLWPLGWRDWVIVGLALVAREIWQRGFLRPRRTNKSASDARTNHQQSHRRSA